MIIKLQSLHLKNFKGIKEFKLVLNGSNASIYGENGTGKSTLYDSFLWVLFDKDSSNRKDFSIKTYDANNNVIHGLEHEVEIVLLIDGRELKLRKTLTEKWTKKRGEAEKEFTGHETKYWVDDVPVLKGEYTAKINELIDENLFKLITNPLYFNQQLSWQDRRKILLEISGDISDQEVIESNEKLFKITEILNGKTIDDYKKILSERIKKLNEDIEKIPVRIDELYKSIPEINEDYSIIEANLQQLKSQLSAIEQELTNVSQSSNEYIKKQQDLYKLREKLDEVKRTIEFGSNVYKTALVTQKNNLINEKLSIDSAISNSKTIIEQCRKEIAENSIKLEMLRNDWSRKNQEIFTEDNCPTCGQELPENQIQELKLNFDNIKKSSLESINNQGKAIVIRNKELEEKQNLNAWEVVKNEQRINEINIKLQEIEVELNQPVQEPKYEENTKYCELFKQIEQLQNELNTPIEDKTTELLNKKNQITDQIDSCNKILNNRFIVEKTKNRIDELKREERTLAAQLNELDGHKYLIEQFIKAKVNLLESSINEKFSSVKFKLFDVQINGGTIEVCNTLVNGVPFTDVNHAGQVNAGIDIINTLSNHYQINAPLWIDNREAINELIDTNSQVINLIVSKDKQLRLEL